MVGHWFFMKIMICTAGIGELVNWWIGGLVNWQIGKFERN
jgi:hypothetical protein